MKNMTLAQGFQNSRTLMEGVNFTRLKAETQSKSDKT